MKKDIKQRTILFERAFGVDIRKFPTTEDVNKLISKARGLTKLEIVRIETDLVTNRGNIFRIVSYDIDKRVDDAVGR
jgi:hypothetical protein